MRPLPPFNLRPVRKRSVVKGSMVIKARDGTAPNELAVKALPRASKVKPAATRAKPQLKVLGEKAAC